ncbi:hydroxyacid dehydrogenase [Marinobacterium aestuarii]|uniref:Hydroxyacid dehydrogenase n=1 Tax=Marinobacterium aestuarii TaxID=1821621 RepID=A0A1A9F2L1_9GAMM|nr:hydroxyacid dehydrogenase [Marinobacterium aestuarii]ANG64456.1 hydroxyacid dehydrogenase [Marinobacterium aestuarii]
MSYTILITAPALAPAGRQLLEARGCETIYIQDQADVKRLEECLSNRRIDAVISRTMQLTSTMIDSCSTLKVISKHGVGVSNIDLEAARGHGIAVLSTPGANTQSVVEFSIGLMLASARFIAFCDSSMKSGKWERIDKGIQLAGRTLGLVGFGQIGRGVARIANAMGMQVLVFDPALSDAQANNLGVERISSIDKLLPRSQVLSLHCPAKHGAPPLLDASRLALLPRGAVVINTARGELIDEQALAAALRSGQLAAAGLDTFVCEPLPADSPLRQLENVLITPHVAGSTPDALAAMAEGAVRNALEYLDQHP